MRRWRRSSWLRDSIGHLVCLCVVVVPVLLDRRVYADEIIDEAKKGQDTGANLLLNYTPPAVSDGPAMDPLGPNEIGIRDLFPGYDPADSSQIGDLSDLADDPEDLSTQGVARQFSLQTGSDETSEAYQAIQDGSTNPHAATIDMRNEAFLDRSRQVISGDDPLLDEILTACAEDVTAGDPGNDTTTHLEEVWTCSQRRQGVAGSCSVERNFELVPVATQVVFLLTAEESPTGDEHWDTVFGLSGPTTGHCSIRMQEPSIDFSPYPPGDGLRLRYRYEFRPSEPALDVEQVWSGYYCGTHQGRTSEEIEAACNASADNLESRCRNTIENVPPLVADIGDIIDVTIYGGGSGNCSPYTEPGPPFTYAGCPDGREESCLAMRERHYAACTGEGTPEPLSGTETITAPGLGSGTAETVPDTLFGVDVQRVETGFNPGDYGLAAGEYVISNHIVSGEGVTDSSIDDGGSYGTDWDYTFTVSLDESPGFEVEATLYEIVANDFVFSGCSQADVENVDNGTCVGGITCTDYTPPCRVVDGVTLCEGPSASYGVTEVLSPWSDFTSVPPEMCWAIDVDIIDCVGETNCIGNPACTPECSDLPPELQAECLAEPCWVDAQGNTVCLDDTSEAWVNNLGEPGFVDDCADLLSRTECQLLPEIACVEGMEDDADPENVDACLLRQRFFDCGSEVTVPGTPGADDVDVTCGASIRCFGDECGNTEVESNPDFTRAAVAATAVTETTKDVRCDIQGDPGSCTVFDGTDERCKDPRGSYLGIIPDCCAESRQAGAAAGDFVTYMQLAYYSYRLARDPIVSSWLAQSQVGSGIQNVVNTPANVGGSVSRAIVNGFNSTLEWAGFSPIEIAGEVAEETATAVADSATQFGPIQQFIGGGVDSFLRSIGAEGFADSLFTTSADGAVTGWAAEGLGQMVGAVLSVIGLIYTVYNVLRILGSIFFACEEEELAFGIQQVNRMCHHVGTYCSKKVSFLGIKKCVIEKQTHCCFSSPFARIINEQLRLQGIGPEWGDAKQPNCDGIPISELENVDWDQVDLSEWEAILFEAGLVPDPRNPPTNFVPTDLHVGTASGGDEGRTSTDIMEETIETVMPVLDEGRFDLSDETLDQPDPELMPWYEDGGGG